MRRVYQIFGLILLAFSMYVAIEVRTHLRYYTKGAIIGPGPGFFPFWISVLLAALTLLWLIQISFKPVKAMGPDFIPNPKAAFKIAVVAGSMVAFTALVGLFGFSLMMFGFLFGLLITLGRHKLVLNLILSVGGSWGLTYLFRALLEVPLPFASIEALKNLGL